MGKENLLSYHFASSCEYDKHGIKISRPQIVLILKFSVPKLRSILIGNNIEIEIPQPIDEEETLFGVIGLQFNNTS
jgi:hypothetical protein